MIAEECTASCEEHSAERAVENRSTLLGFDFDGTLAPICEDPWEARIRGAAQALLAEAIRTPGVTVAIVSGRDVDDLFERVGVSGAYMVGSHGLEIRAPGDVVVRDAPKLDLQPPPDLQASLEAAGVRIERKKHGIAAHWRGRVYDEVISVLRPFRRWARDNRLDLIDGRCVIEARMPGGDKAESLRWLARKVAATRVIYAGDDVTDFGPLRFAANHGRAVFVASNEREAPTGVTIVATFRELSRVVRQEMMRS